MNVWESMAVLSLPHAMIDQDLSPVNAILDTSKMVTTVKVNKT